MPTKCEDELASAKSWLIAATIRWRQGVFGFGKQDIIEAVDRLLDAQMKAKDEDYILSLIRAEITAAKEKK